MDKKAKQRVLKKIKTQVTTNPVEAENIYYTALAMMRVGHYRQIRVCFGLEPRLFKNII